MDVQAYLQHLLKDSGNYIFNETELKYLASDSIEEFIYAKLTSKKYRKFKMDDACASRTRNAINLQVKENTPVTIIFPQGGYKLWRFHSSPAADWAEFFNIAYLLEYIAPVASAYKPGVKLVYYLHTLLMELHDNLTTEEIKAYVNSFEKLLTEFRKYLPENISISILRDADLYTRDEYFKALEEGRSQAEAVYRTWPQEKKDDYARMSTLNIKWDGKEDWTKLSEEGKKEKVYQAALYEMAATSNLPKVAETVKSDKNILVFTKASPMFIGIGSTKASIAKYWVGFGVLEKRGDSYLPIILTPAQYELAMKMPYEKYPVNIFPEPNFSEIYIFNTPFNFHSRQ